MWKVSYFETRHSRVVIPLEGASQHSRGREEDASVKSGT